MNLWIVAACIFGILEVCKVPTKVSWAGLGILCLSVPLLF